MVTAAIVTVESQHILFGSRGLRLYSTKNNQCIRSFYLHSKVGWVISNGFSFSVEIKMLPNFLCGLERIHYLRFAVRCYRAGASSLWHPKPLGRE